MHLTYLLVRLQHLRSVENDIRNGSLPRLSLAIALGEVEVQELSIAIELLPCDLHEALKVVDRSSIECLHDIVRSFKIGPIPCEYSKDCACTGAARDL